MNNSVRKIIAISIVFISLNLYGQNEQEHNLSGNLQLNYQTFQEDSTINAKEQKAYTSGYTNLLYNYKNFTIGTRLEIYNNPIDAFEEYDGYGIANKFIQYKNNFIDITLGNIYDEFGSGLVFRTYSDPNLGVDNSINGVRLKIQPTKGVYITGLIGNQKSYWEYSESLVRALNTDVSVNELLLKNWKSIINIGASFVTKKEDDNNPLYILPENVGAFNTRLNITKGNTTLNIDYGSKINDPSGDNQFIYQNGHGLIINGNYSKKGFGVSFGAKRIQNMSFRSERNAKLQDLNINYIIPFTKQQSYSLATMYPYTTQQTGEMGSQIDIYYKIPKKSKIGGKYGTNISFNYSNIFDINKIIPENTSSINESGTLGYNSQFLKLGYKLFQEINLEISRKINRKLKLIGTFIHLQNHDDKMLTQWKELITANVIILEVLYKIKAKHSTRIEIQHLQTKQDYGNWCMGLLEYKISPHWFWSIQDLYNYGHPTQDVHYYSISTGYNHGANRIAITYGKQRAGLFCVGGVCREVPASNGFTVSLTSSF
ncbi:MAG: hypothetical protein CMP56_01035 [Flavobacteriales bacterium]|nr:hypothetical protein [Flavobacteriales bacterium]